MGKKYVRCQHRVAGSQTHTPWVDFLKDVLLQRRPKSLLAHGISYNGTQRPNEAREHRKTATSKQEWPWSHLTSKTCNIYREVLRVEGGELFPVGFLTARCWNLFQCQCATKAGDCDWIQLVGSYRYLSQQCFYNFSDSAKKKILFECLKPTQLSNPHV